MRDTGRNAMGLTVGGFAEAMHGFVSEAADAEHDRVMLLLEDQYGPLYSASRQAAESIARKAWGLKRHRCLIAYSVELGIAISRCGGPQWMSLKASRHLEGGEWASLDLLLGSHHDVGVEVSLANTSTVPRIKATRRHDPLRITPEELDEMIRELRAMIVPRPTLTIEIDRAAAIALASVYPSHFAAWDATGPSCPSCMGHGTHRGGRVRLEHLGNCPVNAITRAAYLAREALRNG